MDYFKSLDEIKTIEGSGQIFKLAREWEKSVEQQTNNLGLFLEHYCELSSGFQNPVFHGKREECLAYENDGNTRTEGTKWNFYLAFPYHNTVIDRWQFSQGTFSYVLGFKMELNERNYDGKVFYKDSHCTCYGFGKGTRIYYTTNDHLITLGVKSMADIVDIINQTISRIQLERKLESYCCNEKICKYY